MLKSLKVRNYALIQDLEIEFDSSINVITGETGAGKSIILGALGISLGNRVDTQVMRNKAEKCVVESVFDISNYNLEKFFQEADLDYEPISIFRREIKPDGRSRAFVNDTPVTTSVLQELTSQLIEIHSQHDNLALFQTPFQFQTLDTLCGIADLYTNFSEEYKILQQQKGELLALEKESIELQKNQDYNAFLYNELTSVRLDQVNEHELREKLGLANNYAQLQEAIQKSQFVLDGENGVLDGLISVSRSMDDLPEFLVMEIQSLLKNAIEEIQDASRLILKLDSDTDFDPEEIQSLNELDAAISNLKLKHRVETVSQLIEIQQDLEKSLNNSNAISGKIDRLKIELSNQEKKCHSIAKDLGEKRLSNKNVIEEKLNQQLSNLGMEHSRILFHLEPAENLNNYGMQHLSLKLSSDGGKTFGDIKKSASGGELARINLSIKSELSEIRGLPTSIFDEIDTGVSGEIARKVGLLMNKMSQHNQIIAITHLPQIASFGNAHLFVYKNIENGEVHTSIKKLQLKERILEIAKMISGDETTNFAIEQSKALLQV